MGVCRNHRTWLQLRAYKILYKSVRKNAYVVTKNCFRFLGLFRALGVESPREGDIPNVYMYIYTYIYRERERNMNIYIYKTKINVYIYIYIYHIYIYFIYTYIYGYYYYVVYV